MMTCSSCGGATQRGPRALYCVPCQADARRATKAACYAKNREEIVAKNAARNAVWLAANPEEAHARDRAYRAAHVEERRAYRAAHVEKQREYNRAAREAAAIDRWPYELQGVALAAYRLRQNLWRIHNGRKDFVFDGIPTGDEHRRDANASLVADSGPLGGGSDASGS